MKENDLEFKENVKLSFFKVKEHINRLENELKLHRELISKDISKIDDLNKKIDQIKDELSQIKDKIDHFISSSTGNDGVLTTNKQQTNNKQTTNKQQTNTLFDLKPLIEPIKSDIEKKFLSLTNLEFKVFLTIYQLEEDLKRPITYDELSQKTGLSQSFIRGIVRELILRQIPISKTTTRNRKVSLSVPQEFKNLNLASKLLKYKEFNNSQTTLFGF